MNCIICRKKTEETYNKICASCLAKYSETYLQKREQKYYQKLKDKRKYEKGEPILSFDELLKQDLVYMYGRPMTKGVVLSQQFRVIVMLMQRNGLSYVVKKEVKN